MSEWAGIDEFVAVAQAASFSHAARRLGRSTSQLSRDIAQLEDRLGLRLLYRTTRHVSLTDAGQHFYESCRKLIEERDDAVAAITMEERELHGHLRMTCSVAYGERFIVPLVTRFALRHPRLSVDIELTDTVLDLVAEGFDLAIRFGHLADSSLVATRLASRTRQLCASPAYLQAAGVPTSLADLAKHSCIRGTAAAWSFASGGKPVSFKPVGRWRCNSGMAVLDAALQGLGLCQLPDFYLREHLQSGALVAVLEECKPNDEGVWAMYPHRRHLAPKVAAMIQFLQEHLAERLNAPGSSVALA